MTTVFVEKPLASPGSAKSRVPQSLLLFAVRGKPYLGIIRPILSCHGGLPIVTLPKPLWPFPFLYLQIFLEKKIQVHQIMHLTMGYGPS